jgi:hypothetical protein
VDVDESIDDLKNNYLSYVEIQIGFIHLLFYVGVNYMGKKPFFIFPISHYS